MIEVPHTMRVPISMGSTSTCVMFPSLGHHPVMAALRVNRALETMVLKWYIILTTHRNRQLSVNGSSCRRFELKVLLLKRKEKNFEKRP
jgi:hypothetical protein